MPTYQYVCTKCGDQIEVVQKFTDDPLTVHEADGGRLRKVFSPVGIVFKGSGFYRTDSRKGAATLASASSSSGEGSSSDSPSSSGGSEKSEKNSEKSGSSSGSDKDASSSSKSSESKSSGSKSSGSKSAGASGEKVA